MQSFTAAKYDAVSRLVVADWGCQYYPVFMTMNKYLLENRMIATLEDIFFSDETHIEYTVHWGNDNISMVSHVTGVVDEGKIIKLEPCKETSGVFANIMGPTWRKNITVSIDKRILGMKTWALTQRVPRAA